MIQSSPDVDIRQRMGHRPMAERFGPLVRKLRKAHHLSQMTFAERCGLHRTYIGAIERGEKTVTIETAGKLARALGVRLSELFRELGE